MKLKTVSLVVGALAAVSVAVHLATRPAPAPVADVRVGMPLLSPDKAEKAAGLLISDQGKSLTLTRQADGSWIVPAYHGFPADFTKLSQLIDELMRAKVDRFVSANPERLAQFEFKDSRIALQDAEGKLLWGVVLGRRTETGARLLKFDGEDRAYQSRLSPWLDTEPKAWADSLLLGIKAEDLCRLEIGFPGEGALVLSRSKKEESFHLESGPAGMQPDAGKLGPLLSALSGIRFSDIVPINDEKAHEAAAFARTVRLACFDGRSFELTLARRPERRVPKALETAGQGASGSTAALAAAAQAVTASGTGGEATKPAADLAKEETIPAGPVFVHVSSSDIKAPVNAMMKAFAFQAYEYAFTSLPSKPEELLQPEMKKEVR
jgi:hypothetical protein